jgi:Undecaprenyl-phosphate glucose phosphotransferase
MDESVVLAAPVRARRAPLWPMFGALVACVEFTLIVGAAVLSAAAYHRVQYGEIGDVNGYAASGAILASIFVALCASRRHYRLAAFLPASARVKWPLPQWGASVLYGVTLAFLLKAGGELSRGSTVLVALVGVVPILVSRRAVAMLVIRAAKTARLRARRILLVGWRSAIEEFAREHQPWMLGLHIVGSCALDAGNFSAELNRAAELARHLEPDDVFILVPWSETHTIEKVVDKVVTLPTAVHLGPERVLGRFHGVHIQQIGSMATLCLVQAPLSRYERFVKRAVDVVGATVALIILWPLFVLVAIAIKLDSDGPVLFTQVRYGFNQKPFDIFKFRTMTVQPDEDVTQARPNDPRVTRVGRFLRRWNLDELPQLVNVVRNEMSLVGPRPHAVPHNLDFEQRTVLYARRHNVKPGITGWAQVNGFRGPTDTEDKLHARLEHDLYYIEHWSLSFDMAILLRTVLSTRAYRNAH